MSSEAVSIIIPAWNEAKTLNATLESLLLVDYERLLCEVIVVAGGNDDTYQIARNLAEVMHAFSRYVVILQKPEGKNAAIQLGVKEAKNDIIVLLDADTMVTHSWLSRMVNPIEQGSCDLTISNPEPVKRTWISEYYMITKAYALDSIVTYSGNSMAFKCNIVEDRLEYFFDENIKVGVDYLLAKRLLGEGHRVMFAKDASVITHMPSSLKYFVLTELRWLTARINIDGMRYRNFAAHSAIIAALILTIPLSKTLFVYSLVFHAMFIARRVRVFLIGSKRYDTGIGAIPGFVMISYVHHLVGFIAHMRQFIGLRKEAYLYQGERY